MKADFSYKAHRIIKNYKYLNFRTIFHAYLKFSKNNYNFSHTLSRNSLQKFSKISIYLSIFSKVLQIF